jgi:hypothetical protein
MDPIHALNKYVLITAITDLNGSPIVPGLDNICNEPNQPGTHMSAQITPWGSQPNNEINYKLTFHLHTIDNRGRDTSVTYIIDPKLRIH